MGKTNKKNISIFKNEVYSLVKDEYTILSEEYVNSHTKVLIRHNICNNEYSVMPYKFLDGRRCPYCQQRVHKDTEYFQKEINEKTDNTFMILSQYNRADSKITMKHLTCDRQFITTPNQFLRRCSCPLCGTERKIKKLSEYGKSQLLTTDIFKNEVYSLVKDDYSVIGQYINNRTKIQMQHNKCGNIYYVTPGDFKTGYRCPRCRSSKAEAIIREYLIKHNVLFTEQKRFDNCVDKRKLPFDFYLDEYNILIEYDGEQHTQPIFGEKEFVITQNHDQIKNNFCRINNIPLLRISYIDKNNIEIILDQYLIKYINKNVSTNPDECKDVESNDLKQKAQK